LVGRGERRETALLRPQHVLIPVAFEARSNMSSMCEETETGADSVLRMVLRIEEAWPRQAHDTDD
jgi:hypothetical protein